MTQQIRLGVTELPAGPLHAFFRALQGMIQRVNGIQTMAQATPVRDLYVQPGPCVEFQDQRSVLFVEDNIDAQISQFNRLETLGGH